MNFPSNVFAIQFYCNGTTEHHIDVKSNSRLGNSGQDKNWLGQLCGNAVRKSDFSPTSIPQIILSGYIRLSQLSPLSTCQSSKVSFIMPANNSYLVFPFISVDKGRIIV